MSSSGGREQQEPLVSFVLAYHSKSWNTCTFYYSTTLDKGESQKQKGGACFCQGCQLRMSGFHYRMFKPRCLVFPFQWLKGQAGLCLAPSHLPSHFPVKGGAVLSAAYLRSHCGICCPFYFNRAGMVAKMRQTTLLDVYPQGFEKNMAWILGDRHISPSSSHLFCFPGVRLTQRPFLYLLSSSSLHPVCSQFLSKGSPSAKKQMCFVMWRKQD